MFNKKTFISLVIGATSLISASAYAATPGFYLGAQAGYGKVDEGVDIYSNLASPNNRNTEKSENGIAGRLSAGYNFNSYVGVEAGYTQFSRDHYKVENPGLWMDELNLKTHAWDIVAKGYLPFGNFSQQLCGFNGFAKLGVAYITHSYDEVNFEGGKIPGRQYQYSSDSSRNWRPTYGLGLAYNINQNIALDVSWTRIDGKGDLKKDIKFADFSPTIDFYAIGLTYTFA